MENQPTVQKLNTLTQRIEYVLEKYPDTRNSDLELQAYLFVSFYPKIEKPIANYRDFVSVMRTLPSLDHIARARRKVIQAHNYTKYLPTVEAVAIARGVNQEVWRAYALQTNIPKQHASNTPQEYKRQDERDEL